jgi:hypothetical protein
MKFLLSILIATSALSLRAQDLQFYTKSEEVLLFSEGLNDSVGLTVHIPKDYKFAPNRKFPLMLIMDSQNEINHRYNLHTIDYLTGLGGIPSLVLASIRLKDEKRGLWTIPSEEGGKGDDFLKFITEDLNLYLTKNYRLNASNFMIGHSRTAIFAMYALAKKPDYFVGCVASSAAYFDGGSKVQKNVFDNFIKENKKSKTKKYFYFSAGTEFYGDGHEPFCDELNAYLSKVMDGTNIEWAYIKEDADHFTIPGLTVNRALNNIFRDYRKTLQSCFVEIKKPENANAVAWKKFEEIYKNASTDAGYEILPDLTFYFSLASAYANDYDGLFKNNATNFSLEMLLEGERNYPQVCEFIDWIKEIYLEKNDSKRLEYEEKLKSCISIDE